MRPGTLYCLLLLDLCCAAQNEDRRFSLEISQGINKISLASGSARVGHSGYFGLTYRAQKPKTAISFELGLQVGIFSFRSQINSSLLIKARHVNNGLMLHSGFDVGKKVSVGPAMCFFWISSPEIWYHHPVTRLSISHSDFGPGYDHRPIQTLIGLQSVFKIGSNDRVYLKLQVLQHVTTLLNSDYFVAFMTTPPSPTRVISADLRPAHLLLSLSFKLKSKNRTDNEE